MGLPTESSRNKGRESAIETLIDMDEAGAAYRVSRTMSHGLLSSLHSRFNRITDSSLFDQAKALSVYEIPASSDAVLTHLRHDNPSSGGSADDAISTPKSKSETSPSIFASKPKSEITPPYKQGWEERVLRHHDKIVRTKNTAAASSAATVASTPPASARPPWPKPLAEQPPSSSKLPPRENAAAVPSSAFDSAPSPAPAPASPSPPAKTPTGVDLPRDRTDRQAHPLAAVPPPQLVSALRQIFGSGSSPDARDVVSSRDDDEEGANDDHDDDSHDTNSAATATRGGTNDPEAASALPSLLQAVLHHSAFGSPSPDGGSRVDDERSERRGTFRGGRTTVAPSAKKDWKSLFDGAEVGNEDGSSAGGDASGDGGGMGYATPASGRDSVAGEAVRGERTPAGSVAGDVDGDVDVDADGDADDGGEGAEGRGGREAGHVSADDEPRPAPNSTATSTTSAANLEAILGNVCRNHIGSLDRRAPGSDNDRIRGLLIASLSIMTTCLLSEEDLEGGRLRLGNVGRQDPPGGGSGGAPRLGYDVPSSSSTATLADGTGDASQLLQVGGILSILRGSLPESIDGLSENEKVEKLFLEESLLDYFAEASSTYEERIEIQKDSLLGGRRSGSGSGGKTTKTTDTPIEPENKSKKKMGMLADLLTPKEGGGRTTMTTTTTTRGRDSLNITATSALSELLSSTSDADTQLADDIANATSILLGNIANLVGEEDDDEDDGLGSGNGDDSGDDQDDDVEHGQEQDEEGNRASLEQHIEDGERRSANNVENTGESARQNDENDRDQVESDNLVEDSSENDGGDDDETMLLQRALALSLASTISAGASDGSNSEHGDDAAKTDASSVKQEDKVIGGVDKDEKSSKKSREQPSSPRDDDGEENAVDLPPLPELPSLKILPKSSLYDITVLASPDREDSVGKSSIFDPSTFSTYGNLPASHVLIHLLRSMLGLLQDPSYNALTANDSTTKSGSSANEARSPFFTPTSAPVSVLKNSSRRFEAQGVTTAPNRNDQNEKSFAPDSATASLLIASLHLSNHLRDSSLTVLRNLLADIEVCVEISTDDGDDAEQSIQIANSAESEDLLPEKDDPASGMATADALEAKGLKRKAAAAAQMASLRHSTKQKLVGQWKDLVNLYSLCCYLTMQCLRSFVGKCTQQGLDHDSDRDGSIRLSAKTRSGLVSILSSFHSVSASISYQNIQDSMEHFVTGGSVAMENLGDSFLVKPLCNESLLLWGASIPLLYPDHTERVNLLHELIRNNMVSDTSNILFPANRFQIESCNWNESELQRCKLEILCWRLRISDMLGHFIAQPMTITESNDQTSRTLFENRRQVPNNSLSTFSLLGPFVERNKTLAANPAKFYLALCQRAIQSLLLWNDLSLSSNDVNDHDISGGGLGTSQAGTWGEGTMQLEFNPTKFHFDSTKCSDSIAIVPSGSSTVGATANQRATKVWGTVLSTTCFTPKSGVHRWAVKLDKCERGHVFVGVATARASAKTYVGGDKNGWGLIGTQALWHDRNKIRGDYGAPFRTGAVVIATLDTNAGTLSFGLWKDASPSSDGASGPMSPSQGMSLISSPRKTSSHGAGGAVIEDWGVAFEGLPLDVKLYPAVGLYQRDDRVSLYTVSNSDLLGSGKSATPPLVSSGSFYYPSAKDGVKVEPRVISGVRAWNRSLCADGIAFTSEALIQTIKVLTCESTSSIESSILMTRLLPSLASSICLIPSCLPTLSAKYAMEFMPLVTRCAKLIDRKVSDDDDCRLGLVMKEGLWVLRAKSSSSETDSQSSNLKEYEVQLSRKSLEMNDSAHTIFKGEGKSKSSRSQHETLSFTAATCGTHIQIIEEWKSTGLQHSSNSHVIIDGRLNLDGTKLEGFYFCKEDGSTGQISGKLEIPGKVSPPNCRKQLVVTEALLCQAVGHLALMLSSKTVLADVDEDDEHAEDSLAIIKSQDSFQQLLQASRILSCGRIDRRGQISRRIADSIRERCRAINASDHVVIVEEWENLIYRSLHTASDDFSTLGSVEAMEAKHTIQQYSLSSKDEGSFSRLCADEYKSSRIKVAASILYHIRSNEEKSTNHEGVLLSWRTSLQIMETGIREALLNLKPGLQRKEACVERCRLSSIISSFLLDFPTISASASPISIADEIAFIYKSIRAPKDLELIKLQMDSRTEKSTLRFIGFRSLELLLQTEDSVEGISNQVAIETTMTSLPRLLRQSPPSFIPSEHLSNYEQNNQHYSSIIAGCAPSIHRCLTSSVHSIYECLGAILASTIVQDLQTNQKTIFSMSSFMFRLLANYFTVLHQSDFKSVLENMMPSLAKFIEYCREDALKEEDSLLMVEEGLLCAVNRNTARRLLHTCASVILSTCAQLSSQEETPVSARLVKTLLHLVLQELSATIPIAGKGFMHREKKKLLNTIFSDWDECNKYLEGRSSQPGPKTDEELPLSTPILTALIGHISHLSMKSSASPSSEFVPSESLASCRYLNQLLNILHIISQSGSFLKSVRDQSNDWINALLSPKEFPSVTEDQEATIFNTNSLPLRYRLRILRLLRPLILSIEANPDVVRHILELSGAMINFIDSEVSTSSASITKDAVSLLRYLYAFSGDGSHSWRNCIHQVVEDIQMENLQIPSVSKFAGVYSFLGGSPGILVNGSFVIVEPDVASTMSSSLNSSSGKSRSSAGGSSTVMTNSAGSGVESVIAGLCRHHAIAGILSGVDYRHGVCEVVTTEKFRSQLILPPTVPHTVTFSGRAMTIRAVRVNASELTAVDELPLHIDKKISTRYVFSTLVDPLKLLISSMKSSQIDSDMQDFDKVAKPSGKEDAILSEQPVQDTLICAMGLRSCAILVSDPEMLESFVSENEDEKALILALALQMATLHTSSNVSKLPNSLSSLPAHEARFHYLLSMRSMVNSRSCTLRSTSNKSLKDVFDKERPDAEISGSSSLSSRRGLLRSPPAGTGSSSTSTADRTAANSSSNSNRRDEEESVSTAETAGQNQSLNASSERQEEDESDTAAAHLREAAIAQMAELGLPRQWAELALRRTGGTNIEAAVHFCLERGGDMERLLAEDLERRGSGANLPTGRRRGFGVNSRADASNLIRQLVEMGFPRRWCAEALAACRNNVDEALTWILTNGERLSAEDEGAEEDEEDDEEEVGEVEENDDDEVDGEEDDEDDEDEDSSGERTTQNENAVKDAVEYSRVISQKEKENEKIATTTRVGWSGSICPVRFVSGKSSIDAQTLEITGLPNGGFSSVGTKGVLLTSGKWYYEAEIKTAGCLQIGWADASFAGHCQADRGDGCGDGPSSWAFDGWRRYRWHSTATEWGCRWSEGDVVGCLVDMDSMTVSFTLNGKGEEIGMGIAFSGEGFRPCSGVYACVSFNRREKIRLILGGEGTEPFKYPPPSGYRGVGEAILEAVEERNILLEEEKILQLPTMNADNNCRKKYICDFSDGEHGHELFAWQHRYHGSDASVHLGASRSSLRGLAGSLHKSSKGGVPLSNSNSTSGDISGRLIKVLERLKSSPSVEFDTSTFESRVEFLKEGYARLLASIDDELKATLASLCILYSRKLVIHVIISQGVKFSPTLFPPNPLKLAESLDSTEDVSRSLWRVIENCASLHTSGWVGEAGAMAVAAEALGLGISSFDHNNSSTAPAGMCTSSDEFDHVIITSGRITQFLNSAILPRSDVIKDCCLSPTFIVFAACAEPAIGSDAGGSLSFLRAGLQTAVVKSASFRHVVLAAVRKAVRLLAAIEYTSEEMLVDDEDSDVVAPSNNDRKQSNIDSSSDFPPDARLTSFLTGLLLSEQVSHQLPEIDIIALRSSLFEGWCVGLLSASSPWRMVCSLTAAGILNLCPAALYHATSRVSIIAKYFSRLENTVARRVWAERAATPVCSRYCQAMIELLSSVKRSLRLEPNAAKHFIQDSIKVDAATPLPLESYANKKKSDFFPCCESWEWSQGWVSNNFGWEILIGSVEIMEVEWKQPPRSVVRTLMDGGEGPPLLREGCLVMRGPDWDKRVNANNEDGRDLYEKEKLSKDAEKLSSVDQARNSPQPEGERGCDGIDNERYSGGADSAPEQDAIEVFADASLTIPNTNSTPMEVSSLRKKKKKTAGAKLPLGTVLSIESWNGIPGVARRVRWNLTGKEGVYRYGGDGGHFDIIHVETNDKKTRVKKRYPNPESAEQCAARYGFGRGRTCNVLLRLRRCPGREVCTSDADLDCIGVLEWPDFGAGILVECTVHTDGAITIREKAVLYGSKDSGWEARFGQPSFVPGSVFVISPTQAPTSTYQDDTNSAYDELLGSDSFLVKSLRNREDGGGRLRVTSEMRLFRSKRGSITRQDGDINIDSSFASFSSPPPPICFDSSFHAPSISLSKDKRTVTCTTSDGRGTAFGNVGFTKGVHYWEVKLEKAEIGSVFIGVAEKPGSPSGSSQGSSYGFESQPRLNRWLGWGFVNFRATYTAGAERVYGAHCHAGDTVGVLLDCDSGRISYFFDGVLYGEHILNDLGCAFENVSPFGFNADGCGSGGAGQGAPSGVDGGRSGRYPSNGAVRPRALWPVIGLRHPGDRVTMSSKWMSSHGVDGITILRNALAVDEVFCNYEGNRHVLYRTKHISTAERNAKLPQWFIEDSFFEYNRWKSDKWLRSSTRGSGQYKLSSYGLDVDLDTSPFACAAACAAIGLPTAFLPGDLVDVKRSAGRILELQEKALVLGTYQGRLFYRLISQKSEGGSLMEGGGRAWFWDESEAVEGGLHIIGNGRGLSVELPKLSRFKPVTGGLKIVYQGGAVVRSDLEIFDGSENIGKIPHGTVIPPNNVIERRLNSCGVVRYLVDYEPVGRGWISSRIRGGKEELIVETLPRSSNGDDPHSQLLYATPEDSATVWYKNYLQAIRNKGCTNNLESVESKRNAFLETFNVKDIDEFSDLLATGKIRGINELESDSLIAAAYGRIADVLPHCDEIECSFSDCALIMTNLSLPQSSKNIELEDLFKTIDSVAFEVASESLLHLFDDLPSPKSLMARIAMLRALNRRARLGLPWLPVRPSQEGSAIFGGLAGFGPPLERAGRSFDSNSQSMWAQVPSISARLRKCRGLLFCSVKRSFVDSVMDTTATPTPLSHDEYELPREVRTVRVNRLKARRAIASDDSGLKRKHSVFSQLQRETRGWSGATLRRGFIAKGHGGQKRAFKVKLVGEGVNDYSGPYREVFTDAMREITDLDSSGNTSLGILEPTANNQAGVGEGRDLFLFAQSSDKKNRFDEVSVQLTTSLSTEEQHLLTTFSSLTQKQDEISREIEESLVFLGRLVGTACRHGIPVDLPLPLGIFWKRLAEEHVEPFDCLQEIDVLAFKQMVGSEKSGINPDAIETTLSSQRRLLNSFAEGMSHVLPIELLSIFSGEQLRDIFCGNADIDVELLRKVVEYDGYNEDDSVITYFWEVLREMTTSERKLFLQFVWARNRLPLKESDFDAPFKIQKDNKTVGSDDDYPLPSASTCFFSLSLPEYPDKEVLKRKLIFAIENVTTMESDYVTNDVEISEGWRGL